MDSVFPTSIKFPIWKNAVWVETLAACCIEWVTITIVKLLESSSISSSILAVAMGSRAEQG